MVMYTPVYTPVYTPNNLTERRLISCPECNGFGQVEYEKWSYRSFDDDVGGFESNLEECHNCFGSGEIEADLEEDDE